MAARRGVYLWILLLLGGGGLLGTSGEVAWSQTAAGNSMVAVGSMPCGVPDVRGRQEILPDTPPAAYAVPAPVAVPPGQYVGGPPRALETLDQAWAIRTGGGPVA